MKYGWLRDLPDHRDLKFKAPRKIVLAMPKEVDLSPLMPPVYDQGPLGSCTANASGAAFQYCKIRQEAENFIPSRLFIYYLTRKMRGTENIDSGGYIRDAIKVINKWGAPRENNTWPYIVSQFNKEPTPEAFREAEQNQAIIYRRIEQDVTDLRACLSMAFPVVFGFSVYENFESLEVCRTGILNLPSPEDRMIGGHAVLAVGYNDKTKRFLVRNSYGDSWGKKGYFWMPYKYLEDPGLAADFWTIELTE